MIYIKHRIKQKFKKSGSSNIESLDLKLASTLITFTNIDGFFKNQINMKIDTLIEKKHYCIMEDTVFKRLMCFFIDLKEGIFKKCYFNKIKTKQIYKIGRV